MNQNDQQPIKWYKFKQTTPKENQKTKWVFITVIILMFFVGVFISLLDGNYNEAILLIIFAILCFFYFLKPKFRSIIVIIFSVVYFLLALFAWMNGRYDDVKSNTLLGITIIIFGYILPRTNFYKQKIIDIGLKSNKENLNQK